MKLEKDDGEGEHSLDLAVVSNFGHGFGAINYVFDLSRGKCRLPPCLQIYKPRSPSPS